MGRRRAALALLAAVMGASACALVHPPAPAPPGSDLYTHLTIARHLARGHGFLNDVVYPFSLAFPFGASVPQPVLHRPPGAPLLLIPAYWAGAGQPEAVLTAVRWLWLLLLAAVAGLGAWAALRRGLGEAVAPWLLTLLASPLVAMTVGWGQIEVPAALAFGWLWWQAPRAGGADTWRGALVAGIVAGALTLLRTELAWLPWLCWLRRRPSSRWLLIAGAAQAAVFAPWAMRNWLLTGQPFFNLQFYGFDWATYRALEPEAFTALLRRDPGAVWDKFASGVVYFLVRLPRWLPWPLWAAAAVLAALRIRHALRATGGRPAPIAVAADATTPALAVVALLTLLYAPLSHTVRFMMVVLPVLAWEIWASLAERLRRRRPAWGAPLRHAALAAAASVVLAVAQPRMPGWETARAEAAAAAPAVRRAAAAAAQLPPGPIFTDTAAVPWLADRAAVWSPRDAEVEAEIRRRLPAMRDAPFIRALAPTGEQPAGDRIAVPDAG